MVAWLELPLSVTVTPLKPPPLNVTCPEMVYWFTPVPFNPTVCVLPVTPLLLSVTVNVPLAVPATVGEKVTFIVQELLAVRLAPQLLVCWKFPLIAMLEMLRVPVPELLSVTGCAALDVPTA